MSLFSPEIAGPSPLAQPQAMDLGNVLSFLDSIASANSFLQAGIDGGNCDETARSFYSLDMGPQFDSFLERGSRAISGMNESFESARRQLFDSARPSISAHMETLSASLREKWKSYPDFDRFHPAFLPYSLRSAFEHQIVEQAVAFRMAESMQIYLGNIIEHGPDVGLSVGSFRLGIGALAAVAAFAVYGTVSGKLFTFFEQKYPAIIFTGMLSTLVIVSSLLIHWSRSDMKRHVEGVSDASVAARRVGHAKLMLEQYQKSFPQP